MITLITGGPGTGKTAFVVAQLLEEKFQGRPLYVDGINELQIDNEGFDPDKWHDEVPDGALVVIDECQRYWRPAGSGRALPESIAALETHRHHGLDFFIITQHPSLVHNNVRRLVGRHIHIVSNWQGRKQFEWAECKTDPQSGRQTAVSNNYRLPKKTYSLYKSAEIHTKQQRRIPFAVYVFLAAITAVGYLTYTVFGSVGAKMSGSKPAPATLVPGGSLVVGGGGGKTALMAIEFKPRIPFKPETAPAYDEVRKVTTFPKPAACIYSKVQGCKCFTQQGSIYVTTDNFCLTFIAQSRFDPYKPQPNNKKRKDSEGGVRSGRGRAAGPDTRNRGSLSRVRNDPYKQTRERYVRTVPDY